MNNTTEPCGYGPSPYLIYTTHPSNLRHSLKEILRLTRAQDETIVVYNYMNQDTSLLLDNLRADPNARPPFFWHHIRPDHQRWAIMEIWRNAGPLTRPLFDRGGTTGEYGPNWVAGWLLYSVFRSRDVRNNRNRRKGDGNAMGDGKFIYFYPLGCRNLMR